MSWPLILPMEDQITTGFGGYFFLGATAFATRVCSVYLFGGTLGRLSLRQMSGMESFGAGLGATWSVRKRFMGKRQRCPSPNYILCVGEVTWGLPTQKEMKKTAQKSRVLGLGLPHLPEQQQDYKFLNFFFTADACVLLQNVDDNLLGFTEMRHTLGYQLRGKKLRRVERREN